MKYILVKITKETLKNIMLGAKSHYLVSVYITYGKQHYSKVKP